MKALAEDAKLQRVLGLKSFVTSEAFKEAKESLQEQFTGDEFEAEQMQNGYLDVSLLSKLNFVNGRKSGFKVALYILEGYEEELSSLLARDGVKPKQ